MQFRILIFSVLFFCAGFVNTSAKEYEIPEIRVEVSINADGTVRITEYRTYVFDGSFSWADYRIPKQGFSAISDIQVSENGQAFINENSEARGTFMVEESDDAIRLSWYYGAEDEQRTFTVSYTLEDAVVIGPEWSEFFWNYISGSREKSTEQLDIAISLPQALTSDSLYAWTRGPNQQINLQKTAGTYSVSAKSVDDDEFVKVRTVFPTSVFNQSQVEVNDADFSLEWAQNDEKAYQKELAMQKERDAYLAQIGRQVNIAILILCIIVFYVLYQRYGKRHSTSRFSSQETIMIPDRTHPAPVGWLTSNRRISGGQVMATFLDLAWRGYFKIREEPPEEGFLTSNDPTFSVERTEQLYQDDLLEWEKILIEFVEGQLEEGTHKLHEIFKETNWYSDWKKRFKEFCFDQGWIDQESYTGAYWNISLQLLLVAAGIVVAVLTEVNAVISTLFTVAITVTASIMSLAIIRRTENGEDVYHRWKNYRDGLKNAGDYTVKSDKLDQHFIYAVALGVGKKPIEKLFTTSSDDVPVFAWFVFSGGSQSPGAIASSFSTLSTTGAAAAGGTAGGAGASAGAAGGGAAGGAG